MKNISILIAASDQRVRDQCRQILQQSDNTWIIGESDNTSHTVESIQNTHPGVLILGLDLVKDSHSILVQLIRTRSPGTRVIILANESEHEDILEALAAGAKGYMKYEDIAPFLLRAVQKVYYEGEAWVPRKMVSAILERLRSYTATPFPYVSTSIQ
jgi:NarL family two-component system response regulator YdfI